MSATSCVSEDQILCSICLDVFNDPVTTPCGHNFCNTCISQYWSSKVQCVCPLCKEVFSERPELKVNTVISEIAAEFTQSTKNKTSSNPEQPAAKPAEVQCDYCTGTKVKAIKSCLKCEASYCVFHLEPHLTAPRLKLHQLIKPMDNLKERMCKKHNKPLELFCKTDLTCVCSLCPILGHKNHEFVPLQEEYEEQKAELGKTVAEIQQKIQQRQLKIQMIEQSTKLSREAADREKAHGDQAFTTLREHVEKSQTDFIRTVEEQEKSTEKLADGFIKELQQEISELKGSAAEREQLSHSEDHLHLIQSFPAISIVPPTKDWTKVRVHQRSYEGSVVKAMAPLGETISKAVKMLLKKAELKRVQHFAVDVTLNPETAHPELILSDDGKQVHHGNDRKKLPYSPKRFDRYINVVGKQSSSSGKFYFEVQVEGKTDWAVGMAKESVNKMGGTLRPQEGYWTVMLKNINEYKACAGPSIHLKLMSKPKKVGVFVDYEEGVITFYDVDTAALIFSFTGCAFTHNLLPYFCPCTNNGGKNSAPLVISAVGE
ncbi:E3 ubiquitin-protein ligase TRIM21-like [Genypterus blacodes]|uniref:E3 ubiquitin-protein ligase TRIM21-like n=1 Tax=Genypterus blacodes TaxID=154954 RepID=UPI003F7692B5